MSGETLTDLLRDPAEIARRCRDDDRLPELALVSLAALVLGAAAFGGVLGAFRGDVQILWAAVKLPLAMLATLAVCAPAFHAFAVALGRPWPLRTVVALTLAAAGRAALVLLALAPVLWLSIDVGLTYHRAAVLATLVYGSSGLAALGVLVRGLGSGDGRLATALAFVAVFLAVGGQTAWILRPYLGRPSQDDIPFVRDREGGFADAVVVSARSAVGIYEYHPPPSEVWDVPPATSHPRGKRR